MSKSLTPLLLLFAAFFFLTGCEEDDQSTTIDITTSIPQNVPVVFTDSGTVTFTDQATIDPLQNSEIEFYQRQIQSLKIEKISFKILNYDGPSDGEFEGSLSFDRLAFELNLPRTFLRETADNEVVTTLQVSSEELQLITNLFQGLDPVSIEVMGTAYNSPMSFDLELAIGIQAEAEIIP